MNNENQETRGDIWLSIWDWVKTIIIALIIALPIRWFVAEPFIVQGPSMDPTFHSGQFLIVDRLEYRFENPERGEVIVFRYPNNPKNYYIKRIIGIPGDEIDIRDGTINIKTEKGENISIDEPYVTKDRASHEDYHTVLTQGKYFVLGDNRMNSSDSRAWGNLDQKYIIGQPIIRLFPFNTISLSPGKYSYEKTK